MKYDLNSNEISLQITLLNSDLEISGSDRNDLEIDFSDLRKNAADEIFDVSFENNILKLSQKSKKLSQFLSGEDYPVRVLLPKTIAADVAIDDISGDIKISGIEALLGDVKTKSGDISINEIGNSEADISSISGDIYISAKKGSLICSSVSGDIKADEMECSKLKVKSVSGDIDLDCSFSLLDDAVLGTVSGDITVNFKKYSGDMSITFKSVSGDIELTGNKPGEEKIHLSNVKGDFSNFNQFDKIFKGSFGSVFKNFKDHIKNVSGDSSTSEIRETKDKNLNIQSILDMVAHDKITVEEAEKLIKAIK
ncbi:TPA: hypothetical protein DCR49_08695 [Candidatus Delongbacteria bacterium]|nr:MAG: hypothetical protein A2Y39_01110 [Candidatus Delongbacteria bacterium GWF2_40_14]HAQ62052.1 hypothetical protein [Candidatus Delongbacteria bacterium]